MAGSKVNILSTRPVGNVLKRQALDHDIVIEEIAFISTEELKSTMIKDRIKQLARKQITAIFTSMNSVKAVGNYISGKSLWSIYCVGYATAKQVEKTFSAENITGTGENAEQLSKKIIQDRNIKEVVFFCGDMRRDELPQQLKYAGISVEELVVYKTTGKPQTLTKQYDGILFFSPSAVDSFFLTNTITDQTQIFAIGATTAQTAANHTRHPIIISGLPDKKNLVLSMIEHYSSPKNFRCNN